MKNIEKKKNLIIMVQFRNKKNKKNFSFHHSFKKTNKIK